MDEQSRLKLLLAGIEKPFTLLGSRTENLGFAFSVFFFIAFSAYAGISFNNYLARAGTDTAATTVKDANILSTDGSSSGDSNCTGNVAGIELYGCVVTFTPTNPGSSDSAFSCDTYTSSDDVMGILDKVGNDPQYKAVLMEVDSGGGSPVGGEEIANGLKELGKPSVAWIRGQGDSAAYWASTGASVIVASAGSDVGSIGVTESYTDNAKKNATDGITYNQLTSGIFKDTGTPDRSLTPAERSYLQRDIDALAQNFISAVAANRNLPRASVAALADGSSMLGSAAKDNGLVDIIGTKSAAYSALEHQIGAKPDICWFGPSH